LPDPNPWLNGKTSASAINIWNRDLAISCAEEEDTTTLEATTLEAGPGHTEEDLATGADSDQSPGGVMTKDTDTEGAAVVAAVTGAVEAVAPPAGTTTKGDRLWVTEAVVGESVVKEKRNQKVHRSLRRKIFNHPMF